MGLLNPKLPDGMDWNQYLEQRMSDPLRPNLSSRLTQQDLVNKGLLAIGMAPMGITKASTPAKQLWQMTKEEFAEAAKTGKIHKATGKYTAEEELLKTPLALGEYNKYSPNDIAHFYATRSQNPNMGWWDMMADSIDEGRQVAYDSIGDAYPKLQKMWRKKFGKPK